MWFRRWNEVEDLTDIGNGIPDLAEPFTDIPNGEWNPGEVLYDINQNGILYFSKFDIS